MSFRQTPDAQIARVIFRSLRLQDARWLYFAMACVAVITVAGAAMLLISAPMRWPVRWCLFIVGLVWFLRHRAELFESGPLNALIMSKAAMRTVAALIFAIMGWLITRLIANDGSPYAAVFSRFMGSADRQRATDQPQVVKLSANSPRLNSYEWFARWTVLPWRRYARYLWTHPKPGPLNVLPRAELGFGAAMHWVSQFSFSVGFAALVALAWWLYPDFILQDGTQISPLSVFSIAIVSGMCAATCVLSLADVMLRTPGEQRLMLLLPYPKSVSPIVAAIVWGTLPFVPLVLQDWAAVRAPQAERALVILLAGMLVPISAWAALQWLQLPVWLLALISVGCCLLLLRVRWQRLPGFAQAFPMGRLA